jgi:F-type H+-transporting ATPase subunit b
MRRIILLTALIIIALMSGSFARHYAFAQEHPAQVEPAPESKSTEAQAEPKHEAEQGAEHGAAASEGKHEGGEDAEEALKQSAMVKKFGSWLGIKDPGTAYWVFTVINFAILAITIIVPTKKVLPGLFRNRNTSIAKSIEDARKASVEANARLSEIEGRLGRLDAEIASIRSTAEQQARTEEERLRASTEEEKNKIILAAEQEIAAASASAQRELKQFVADLAVSLAEKKIRLDESTDRHLVRAFTRELGNGSGKGRG